jgi:hypothetical protein
VRRVELGLALVLAGGLASSLGAFGSTSEPWLGGTQPWDSVPYEELNLGLRAQGGDGASAVGPYAQWGIVDQLQLAGAWDQPLSGSTGRGEVLLKVREDDVPRWRPALAGYWRTAFGSEAVAGRPGLVLALEPWDSSWVANLEDGPQGLGLRLAAWTPYVVSFIRLGFEGLRPAPDQAWSLLPQITFQAPGDISAVLGAQTLSDGSGRWTWVAHLSYELFPSP